MQARQTGDAGEELAADFLGRQGYEIVERNYTFRNGEIDLICRDGDTLVFVEVKTVRPGRSTRSFGAPEYRVTTKKRQQIAKTAEHYLWKKEVKNVPCRFDVVIVRLRGKAPDISLFQNAFWK